MSAENEVSPPTTNVTDSSNSYSNELPLLSLLQQPPLSQMSEEELRAMVTRLRTCRSSIQTFRAEVAREAVERKQMAPKEKINLDEYV